MKHPIRNPFARDTGKSPRAKRIADYPGLTATLDTTELLNLILLHLPGRDILRLQRVSKRWFALITNSIDLQRKLFLEPLDFRQADGAQRYQMLQSLAHTIAHDDIAKRACDFNGKTIKLRKWRPEDVVFMNPHLTRERTLLGPWACRPAEKVESWKGMFLSQPPCKKVIVWGVAKNGGRTVFGQSRVTGAGNPDERNAVVIVEDGEGVTAGVLVKAVRDKYFWGMLEHIKADAVFEMELFF
ncbi:hypothetical protein LTS18_005497 [Coniosporium uncinatum]|uniref:Uncharacterized protein n=1 Tax=Coniosporium uncinatum TaxID=93489 RepID=A0ACC3DRN0_9PEZI|nr:hypothetical protein LTS18_005497 [Coniosporium uncinatum]